MPNVTVSNFIQPYPQAALNGDLGLTSQDLALVLNASHDHVKRRMASIKTFDSAFNPIGLKVSGKGRSVELLVMPVLDAKLVVAKYDNSLGNSYLRFLLECEKVATELTPKLIARLDYLEALLKNFLSQGYTKPEKKLGTSKKGMLAIPFEQQTLFGDQPVITYIMMPMDQVTETAKAKGQLRHLQRQMGGIAKKVNNLQDKLDGKVPKEKK